MTLDFTPGSAKATGSQKLLASEPGGVFGGKKDSDRGNVAGLADAAKRSLRENGLLEIRSDESPAVGAFSLDHAGTEGIYTDLPWAELASEHAGDRVDRGLRARVNRTVRRCDATGNGANVDDAAPLSEVVHSGLRHKEEAQHIDIEVPVKVLLGDGLDRGKLVHAGVVYEDVKSAIVFDGCLDDTLRLAGLGDVARHGYGLTTGCSDGSDDSVRPSLAGSVVHDYRSAFCGQRLSNGGSDALGCACDNCYFAFKFSVHKSFSYFWFSASDSLLLSQYLHH
jgi:hypothetical protein